MVKLVRKNEQPLQSIGLLLIPEFRPIKIAAEVPHPAPTDDCQNRENQKQQVRAIRL